MVVWGSPIHSLDLVDGLLNIAGLGSSQGLSLSGYNVMWVPVVWFRFIVRVALGPSPLSRITTDLEPTGTPSRGYVIGSMWDLFVEFCPQKNSSVGDSKSSVTSATPDLPASK